MFSMNKELYQKLLLDACQKEKEAHDFYMQVAGQIQDSFVRRVFTDIAGVELKHFEQLRKLLDKDPDHLQFPAIENVEAITERAVIPPVRDNMSAEEAVQLAIAMEKKAIEQYGQMAAASPDPTQKQFCIKMIEMENSHRCSFEQILRDMAAWKKK
jgi:rubrerythrin